MRSLTPFVPLSMLLLAGAACGRAEVESLGPAGGVFDRDAATAGSDGSIIGDDASISLDDAGPDPMDRDGGGRRDGGRRRDAEPTDIGEPPECASVPECFELHGRPPRCPDG